MILAQTKDQMDSEREERENQRESIPWHAAEIEAQGREVNKNRIFLKDLASAERERIPMLCLSPTRVSQVRMETHLQGGLGYHPRCCLQQPPHCPW